MFIRAMHNRVGAGVKSFDLSVRDGLVLVPLVLVILAFARLSAAGARPLRGGASSGSSAAGAVARAEATP